MSGEVELIVLDWDGGEALTNCLRSIDAQSRPPSRLIILDNGSTTPVYQRLPQKFLKIPYTIVRTENNLGFTGGINRAMNEVSAPFVGWIHGDAVLSERWLEKLMPTIGGEGKVAGVQSVNCIDKTTVDGAGISVEAGIFRQIGRGEKLARFRPPPQPWGISTTASVFRTHALREVALGGAVLRADLFTYWEDVELCARLRDRGWRFRVVPEALVMHRGSLTAGRLGWTGFRMRVRNRYIVARAHRGVGKVSAFIGEDLSYALRETGQGQFRSALTRMRGVFEGLRRR